MTCDTAETDLVSDHDQPLIGELLSRCCLVVADPVAVLVLLLPCVVIDLIADLVRVRTSQRGSAS